MCGGVQARTACCAAPPAGLLYPCPRALLRHFIDFPYAAERWSAHSQGLLSFLLSLPLEQVERLLCCFMLEDLRRFEAWTCTATRPYTGQPHAWFCFGASSQIVLVALSVAGLLHGLALSCEEPKGSIPLEAAPLYGNTSLKAAPLCLPPACPQSVP